MSKQPEANPKSKTDAAEAKPAKAEVLSEAKRNGKTVRVVTDGVRVWKEIA